MSTCEMEGWESRRSCRLENWPAEEGGVKEREVGKEERREEWKVGSGGALPRWWEPGSRCRGTWGGGEEGEEGDVNLDNSRT